MVSFPEPKLIQSFFREKGKSGVRRLRREKQNLYSRLSHLGNIHESSFVSLALISLRRDQ